MSRIQIRHFAPNISLLFVESFTLTGVGSNLVGGGERGELRSSLPYNRMHYCSARPISSSQSAQLSLFSCFLHYFAVPVLCALAVDCTDYERLGLRPNNVLLRRMVPGYHSGLLQILQYTRIVRFFLLFVCSLTAVNSNNCEFV